MTLIEKVFENIGGEGENVGTSIFFFSHDVFSSILFCHRSANALKLVESFFFFFLNVVKSYRVENMKKGENVEYKHFLLFPKCFQWIFSFGY